MGVGRTNPFSGRENRVVRGVASNNRMEKAMPTDVDQRAPGHWARCVQLLETIRWEMQFKLAKCCMRASIAISDLGVVLAEPVLVRSKALNEAATALRENART
jgi:hypothetical protein